MVRALALASRLNAGLAIVDKRRQGPGLSEVANIVGDVAGRRLIIFDDIVDLGSTLCSAAASLAEAGAAEVSAYITHGVLSRGAVERVQASVLKELVVTDSIAGEGRDGVRAGKIRVGELRPSDRRGDPPDRQRGVRFQVVRLIAKRDYRIGRPRGPYSRRFANAHGR